MALTFYNPTLADLIARCRTYIDEATQANFTNTEIIYALNDAQQDVATEITQVNEHYFANVVPTLITPITNPITQLYAVNSDFFKMIRLEIQTTGEMVPFIDINEKSIDNIAIPPLVNTAGYGAGMQAYMLGNSIGFTPPPTDPGMVFQYWYDPFVPDMTATTDVSILPRNFVDLLPELACVDMFIKDEDTIADIQNKFNRRIDQVKRTARQRQTQNPKYVRRTGFDAPLYPWMGM
jgi:hypothetical protein